MPFVQIVRLDFDGSALETLAMLSRDNDADVRFGAVQALGDFYEDIDANNALFERGFDPDRRVQDAAVTLLPEADDERAVAWLLRGIGQFPPGPCGTPEYRWRGPKWAPVRDDWSRRTGLKFEQAPLDASPGPDFIGLMKALKLEASQAHYPGASGTVLRRANRPTGDSLREAPSQATRPWRALLVWLAASLWLLIPTSWSTAVFRWGKAILASVAKLGSLFAGIVAFNSAKKGGGGSAETSGGDGTPSGGAPS